MRLDIYVCVFASVYSIQMWYAYIVSTPSLNRVIVCQCMLTLLCQHQCPWTKDAQNSKSSERNDFPMMLKPIFCTSTLLLSVAHTPTHTDSRRAHEQPSPPPPRSYSAEIVHPNNKTEWNEEKTGHRTEHVIGNIFIFIPAILYIPMRPFRNSSTFLWRFFFCFHFYCRSSLCFCSFYVYFSPGLPNACLSL